MIDQVEEDKEYYSPSGLKFKVLHLAKHGQDCTWPMVVYTNLVPTKDAPIGTIWVIAESIFMKTMTPVKNPTSPGRLKSPPVRPVRPKPTLFVREKVI